jgi:hypothetical protein
VRLPFPERISLPVAFYCGLLLSVIQVYQGTDPVFALSCFAFIVIAALAFNVAGGLSHTSGSYVFFFAVLVVLIGWFWKAVLGEPADSNLTAPMVTAPAYLCAITGMLGATIISKKLTTKRPLLAKLDTDNSMQSATVGCMITGLLIAFISAVVEQGSGSVLSAIGQLNHFLPLAIILGVIHTIRRSGGTRSINLPVVVSGSVTFAVGVLAFSKEGMFTPFLCWFLAAASQRYKVSRVQIVGGIFLVFLMFRYLVPYAQYGRTYRTDTFFGNVQVAIGFFSDIEQVRTQYAEIQSDLDENDQLLRGYFTTHQGFFDRLQMIGPDDAVFGYTERNGPIGLYPIVMFFENLVPHVIWPDKPTWGGGNLYAREIGILPPEDTTTGISFSPAGEAFRLGGWTGVIIVAPLFWIAIFTLFDSLCGDVRRSPWGLIVVLVYAHSAPETGLGGIVYAMGFVAVAVLFSAFMGTYLMPIIGEFIIGPGQKIIRSKNPIASKPNRIRSIRASNGATL